MTQKPSKHGAILAAALLAIGGAFATSSLSAQTVTTNPVGAVTTSLNTGLTLVGLTMVNPASYTGVVTANTVTQITTTSAANFQSLLSSSDLYYVEITSGLYEGDRFDVDTAATVAAAGSVLTLKSDSSNNTVALIADVLNGSSFVVRKHITLNSLSASVSPAFAGNNSAGSADQVIFYDRVSSSFKTYFLRSDNITWRQTGFQDSVGASTVIPPGVGVFIRRANGATTLTQVGEVRTNDFALPLYSGLSLLASGYPITYSPSALNATATTGWFGSNSASSADQIITFSNATNGYSTFFLRSDGLTWRQTGFQDDVASAQLISFDTGFWVKRTNLDVNYGVSAPSL